MICQQNKSYGINSSTRHDLRSSSWPVCLQCLQGAFILTWITHSKCKRNSNTIYSHYHLGKRWKHALDHQMNAASECDVWCNMPVLRNWSPFAWITIDQIIVSIYPKLLSIFMCTYLDSNKQSHLIRLKRALLLFISTYRSLMDERSRALLSHRRANS